MTNTSSYPKILIRVAQEFSSVPGPRAIAEGPFSGEAFLLELLKPKYLEAVRTKQRLLIDLDDTEGYATSFLEAAFGGLAREFGGENVSQVIELKSQEEPYLVKEIESYIRDAVPSK